MRIATNGITLALADEGAGPAVLLLHGWPDTADLWQHQVPALTAAGFRVLRPDLRGFGDSDKPDDVEAYRLPRHVADLLAILDQLDIAQAHVVGHDWGAAIAWVVAALAPERVASLTALSVGHPAALASAGWEQRQKSWYSLLFQFPHVAEQWLSARNFANFRSWSAHPDADAVVRRLAEPSALTASLGIYRANAPPSSLLEQSRELPPVSAPALGIWSSEDRFLTEAAMTGSQQYVTGPWRYERLEGAGHWLQYDAPEALNRLLVGFLEEVASSPAET